MTEREDYWVDIDPETEDEITPEQAMGAWVPVTDKNGILQFPVSAPFASPLKKNTGKKPYQSIEEIEADLQGAPQTTPGEADRHVSDLSEEERARVLARVKAALAAAATNIQAS